MLHSGIAQAVGFTTCKTNSLKKFSSLIHFGTYSLAEYTFITLQFSICLRPFRNEGKRGWSNYPHEMAG